MRLAVVVCALSVVACGTQPPAQMSASVYTPAHRTFGEAVRHFLATQPTPKQPIPFPHNVHIAKKAVCTDCHESVERSPVAGIPSVKTCMICHEQIATDKPLIKEVAAYSEKGVEIPWQRVYGFPHEAH